LDKRDRVEFNITRGPELNWVSHLVMIASYYFRTLLNFKMIIVCCFLFQSVLGQHTNKPSRITNTRDLWTGGSLAIDLSGVGLTGWVYEGGDPYLSHLEFEGRVSSGNQSTGDYSVHTTWSCGAIAGAGIKYGTRGAAYKSTLVSFNTQNVPIAYNDWHDQWAQEVLTTEALVTNCSFYAANGENELRDDACLNAPHHLLIQGTNYGSSMAASTSTKNILTVGDIDCFADCGGMGEVSESWCTAPGPAKDGRIKPDIVSLCDTLVASYNPNAIEDPQQFYSQYSCTSGATAWTTGVMLLLQELYYEQTLSFLNSCTLKSLVIHNAFDIWNEGPDYSSGWGLLDASKAAEFLLLNNSCEDFQLHENQLTNGEVHSWDIEISNEKPLKATLCWLDQAASQEDYLTLPTALVNNLDLRIYKLENSIPVQEYNAFNLNPNDPMALATSTINNVDNVEQVVVEDTEAGMYRVEVSHQGLLDEPIHYGICIGDRLLEIDLSITDASNTASSDGAIEVLVSGTTVDSYVWSGPNEFLGYGAAIADLAVGSYTVLMTSDTGCEYTRQFWVKCQCKGDVTGNGFVNSADLLGVLAAFGSTCYDWACCPGDYDSNYLINSLDILGFLSEYGESCP